MSGQYLLSFITILVLLCHLSNSEENRLDSPTSTHQKQDDGTGPTEKVPHVQDNSDVRRFVGETHEEESRVKDKLRHKVTENSNVESTDNTETLQDDIQQDLIASDDKAELTSSNQDVDGIVEDEPTEEGEQTLEYEQVVEEGQDLEDEPHKYYEKYEMESEQSTQETDAFIKDAVKNVHEGAREIDKIKTLDKSGQLYDDDAVSPNTETVAEVDTESDREATKQVPSPIETSELPSHPKEETDSEFPNPFSNELLHSADVDKILRQRPMKDVLETTIIYKPDEYGRVRMEQYTQTKISGRIVLDYHEHYETHPERVTHKNVLDAHADITKEHDSKGPEIIDFEGSVSMGRPEKVIESTSSRLKGESGEADEDEETKKKKVPTATLR